MKLVYISSAGHSGSTLLDMLLGAHADAFSLGELILLPLEARLNKPCTCGRPILECPVWRPILARHLKVDAGQLPAAVGRLNLGWMPPDVHGSGITPPSYLRQRQLSHAIRYAELRSGLAAPMMAGRTYREGLQASRDIYGHVLAVTGRSVLVNSSKHYLLAIDNYLAAPDNVKVISLVRDGRAVFNSFKRHGFPNESALNAWLKHYARALPLFRRWIKPRDLMTVRYESLAKDPELTLRSLGEFLDLSLGDSIERLGQVTHHNVNGNDIRFRRQTEIRLDERWRSELDAADLQYFERRAGRLNREFGYGA